RVMTRVYQNSNLEFTRLYMDDYEVTIDAQTGMPEYVHYVTGGDGLAAIVAFDNYFYPSPLYTKYRYAYQDHLGSIVAVTDDQGNVVAEQNFDAWGRERNPQDWTYNTTQIGLTHSWLY